MSKCDCCGKDCADCIEHCALCGGQTYCSAKCKADAWTEHQEDCNVHDVPSGATIAHDYAYEDFCDERELKGVEQKNLFFNQKHRLRTVQPNGKIETREIGDHVLTAPGIVPGKTESVLVKPFGVGDKPDESQLGSWYEIFIQQNQWKVPTGEWVEGSAPDFSTGDKSMMGQTIFKGSGNELVQKLVKSRTLMRKMGNKIVFWPGQLTHYDLDSRGGHLTISVITKNDRLEEIGKAVMQVNYGDLKFKGTGGLRKRARGVIGKLSQQLRIKNLNPATSAALYAKSADSMEVRLIYDTTGVANNLAALEDIEVVVPVRMFLRSMTPPDYSNIPAKIVTQFSVNPRQIEDVTGLVAAFDEHISEVQEAIHALPASHPERAELIAKDRALNATLSVLQGHEDALEEHLRAGKKARHYEVPGKVNAAIHEATQELWKAKHVGGPLSMLREKTWEMDLRRRLKNVPDDKKESVLSTELKRIRNDVTSYLAKPKRGQAIRRGKLLGRARALQKVALDEGMTDIYDQAADEEGRIKAS